MSTRRTSQSRRGSMYPPLNGLNVSSITSQRPRPDGRLVSKNRLGLSITSLNGLNGSVKAAFRPFSLCILPRLDLRTSGWPEFLGFGEVPFRPFRGNTPRPRRDPDEQCVVVTVGDQPNAASQKGEAHRPAAHPSASQRTAPTATPVVGADAAEKACEGAERTGQYGPPVGLETEKVGFDYDATGPVPAYVPRHKLASNWSRAKGGVTRFSSSFCRRRRAETMTSGATAVDGRTGLGIPPAAMAETQVDGWIVVGGVAHFDGIFGIGMEVGHAR